MSGFKPFAEDWPRGGPGTNRVDWQGEIQQGDRLTELDTLADSADYALPGVVRSALRDAAAMIRNLRERVAELEGDGSPTTLTRAEVEAMESQRDEALAKLKIANEGYAGLERELEQAREATEDYGYERS